MKQKYIITITNNITVEINENQTTLTDFITEMDDTIKSRTDDAVILDQQFVKFDEEKTE